MATKASWHRNYVTVTLCIMTHVTCRLTTKNRDQLRNPTLGNRVWATILMSHQARPLDHGPLCLAGNNTIHHSHSLMHKRTRALNTRPRPTYIAHWSTCTGPLPT